MEYPKIVDFTVNEDNRGEIYKYLGRPLINELNENQHLVRDSYVSHSKKYVFRGLHLQIAPHLQSKCFQLLSGNVRFYAVYAPGGEVKEDTLVEFEMEGLGRRGLFVPPEWATGVLTISDESLVWVTANSPYVPGSEKVIRASALNNMKLPNEAIISVKDN